MTRVVVGTLVASAFQVAPPSALYCTVYSSGSPSGSLASQRTVMVSLTVSPPLGAQDVHRGGVGRHRLGDDGRAVLQPAPGWPSPVDVGHGHPEGLHRPRRRCSMGGSGKVLRAQQRPRRRPAAASAASPRSGAAADSAISTRQAVQLAGRQHALRQHVGRDELGRALRRRDGAGGIEQLAGPQPGLRRRRGLGRQRAGLDKVVDRLVGIVRRPGRGSSRTSGRRSRWA